jgi:GNAT superfamily N-acetyltransferase
MTDWFQPPKVVVCRPALPKDTPDVHELTRRIWNGHDYVPEVWADWLADPDGCLAVAEWGGRVVGLFKLSLLGPEEGWLEGLRVHPELEGRGFASRLFDYLVKTWERLGDGTLRLATASFRQSVQHLSERSGFARAGEFTPYQAEAQAPGEGVSPLEISLPKRAGPVLSSAMGNHHPQLPEVFQPLEPGEVHEALELARLSPALALVWGYMDLGWTWAWPDEARLREASERGQAWWWGRREGVLAAREDIGEEEESVLSVQLLACPLERLADLLRDYRRLGGALGFAEVSWIAPHRTEAERALAAAGYRRTWENTVYLYERPARSSSAGFRS